MTEALLTYIRQSLAKGVSPKTLLAGLVKAGWKEKLVLDVMEHASAEVPGAVLLSIEGISKSFGSQIVLDNLQLSVRKGEIFGIIGSSGAGKTTLLNLLVGFSDPDNGDIIMHGEKRTFSVCRHRDAMRKLVGMGTQIPSVYAKLTVLENLLHFGALYEVPAADLLPRIKSLLRLVDLEEHRHKLALNLSGGMQKRLDIACALVHNPRILVLDEPTADLDPIMRKAMMALIREINHKGTTVIIASHFLGEVEHLCNRIAILRNKAVSELGTADELKDLFTRDFIVHVELVTPGYKEVLVALQKAGLCNTVEEKEHELVVRTSAPERCLSVIADCVSRLKLGVRRVQVARPSLQDVFASVMSR